MTDHSPTRTFYRIVKTDPPTVADFVSNLAKGRKMPRTITPEGVRLWDGLSAYNTERAARRQALGVPILGDFIAAMLIAADDPVRIERTLGPGHYTLWGDPALLLSRVVRVAPVRPETTETNQ